MKVYVDELPKDDCPCNRDGRCRLLQKECYVCYFEMEKNEHCPLKSLADYTKQVRKEVCEQIKAEFDTSGFNKIDANLYPPREEAMWIGKGFKACEERLFKKLEQIQGEEYDK